jgi:hypothetical protein
MKILRVDSNLGQDNTIVVPDGCISLLAASAVALTQDASASVVVNNGLVTVSNDLSNDASNQSQGIGKGLMCVANQNFPPIPVSAGERLLVSGLSSFSAVIYFGEEE